MLLTAALALGGTSGGNALVYVADEGKRLQAFRVGDLPEPAARDTASAVTAGR